MNHNLLIIGAGIYSLIAMDIAKEMGCFDKIAYVDDAKKIAMDGSTVVGKISDIEKLSAEYNNMIVAIGNPELRMQLLKKIEEEITAKIVILASPRAYIAPSAQIGKGSIIEPMAVLHSGTVISEGCFISAGAVVNHGSMCAQAVHVDCNAVVAESTLVPAGTKVESCTVFKKMTISANDLFLIKQESDTDWIKEHIEKFGSEPNLFDGV